MKKARRELRALVLVDAARGQRACVHLLSVNKP